MWDELPCCFPGLRLGRLGFPLQIGVDQGLKIHPHHHPEGRMVPCGMPGMFQKPTPKKSIGKNRHSCHGADVQHGTAGQRRHMEAPGKAKRAKS